MKLFIKQSKTTLLLSLVLFTGITLNAMEQQEQEGKYSYLVDAINTAENNKQYTIVTDLLRNFCADIDTETPETQANILVDLIQQAAPQNAILTIGLCCGLTDLYNQHPSPTIKKIISPIIRPLQKHKQTSALEKILCIFADNIESEEYQQINEAIQNKLQHSNHAEVNTDNDAALARGLQGAPDDNFVPGDNGFAQAVRASLAEPTAPTIENLEAVSEEDAIAIATAESLITHTQNTNSNAKTFWNKLYNNCLGGFGS